MRNRILIFNDCFCVGGTEILLVNLLNHLVSKGVDVTLMLPYPSEKDTLLNRVSSHVSVSYMFAEEPVGLKRWVLKNILIFYPNLFRKLIHFKQSDYDQVVCFKDGFYSILFSKLSIPKYIWIQNQPFIRDYKSNSLKEFLSFSLNKLQIKRMNASFDKFDRVICVSDTCKRDYIAIYHKGKQRRELEVLYDALDLSSIKQRALEPLPITQPLSNCLNFVVVIRLSHEKTVDRAILALNRLVKEGYRLKLQILGDGAEFNRLRKMITDYGLDNAITMFGRVANPFPYVKSADWLLCPSSRESFALTLLESISLGTPVVTTACGGPEDVVDRGKYGLLVANSPEGVYEGMKKVLDNPSLRELYKTKANECLERFNYDDWLRAVDKILGIKLDLKN